MDGDTLTYAVVSGPAQGSLSVTGASVTYTPSANYHGSDSFTFKTNDGAADSNVATVSITITSVNDVPVADTQIVTTAEDTPTTITLTGSDVDGDGLTYSVGPPSHGSLGGTAPNLTYIPATNYYGPDSFTFIVNDGIANSASATVSITVTAVNDAPVANPQAVVTAEDNQLTITLTGSDVDGDALTYTLGTGAAHGTLSGTPPNLTYTPNPDYYGADSFTYQVCDPVPGPLCDTAAVSITINSVNDSPVATSDFYVTLTDKRLTIGAPGVLGNDNDIEGDLLTAVLADGPIRGTLTLEPDGSFVYTPDTGFEGTDTFTYRANDSAANSEVVTVTITVASIHDVPIAQNDHYSTREGTLLEVGAAGVIANDYDLYGHTLTATLVGGPFHGSLTFNSDGSFSYTPDADFIGSDTFTYMAYDGSAYSNTAMVTIAVTVRDEVLIANNDSAVTPEDAPVSINVLDNDYREEGGSLTAWLVNPPLFGTVSLNTDGSFTYTPGDDFNGTDSFTYKANDGTAYSNVAMVLIGITGVNDAPVLGAIGDRTINEMEEFTFTATATDIDIPANILTFSLAGAPEGAAITSLGAFTWTPTEAQGRVLIRSTCA